MTCHIQRIGTKEVQAAKPIGITEEGFPVIECVPGWEPLFPYQEGRVWIRIEGPELPPGAEFDANGNLKPQE